MRDSNPRMHESKSCALPTWLIPNINSMPTGVPLHRPHLGHIKSSLYHTNYKNKLGADEGSRTPTPKALDPKSSASANSATSAHFSLFCWWRMVDSNHRSRWQQIYSLPPLAAREILHVELVIGIEPTTCWLQVSCSTVEPHQHSVLNWRPGRDSNPRPPAWQAGILTNWTTRPHLLVGVTGLEPVTPCL